MLEVFIRLLGFALMNILGIYIVKTITENKTNLFNIKSVAIIIVAMVIQYLLYNIEYSVFYTAGVFIMNIFVYKLLLKEKYFNLIVANAFAVVMIMITDIISAIILMNFFEVEEIRISILIYLISNSIYFFIIVMLLKKQIINRIIKDFYKIIIKPENRKNLIVIIISCLSLYIIAYNITEQNIQIIYNLPNIILIFIYTILIILIIKNKNKHANLLEEYDSLFKYIQNFEEWIEKDQLNRHEYKNQLSVLRIMAKSKDLKEKIDEILEDTVDIKNEVINELSKLPKGGVKGLLYYKAAVAEKEKIDLVINVSIQENTYLETLDDTRLKDMYRVMGIFFDNAIEAAKETKKKKVLVEIYEFDSKFNFVLSNTFKKKSNINNKNEKGVSSKGDGRGNGLYFAHKIMKKYNKLSSKQEIIDDYYIQTVTINKKPNS